MAGRGRPKSLNPKQPVSVRLDADLLSKLRTKGKGWQTFVNTKLREVLNMDEVEQTQKRLPSILDDYPDATNEQLLIQAERILSSARSQVTDLTHASIEGFLPEIKMIIGRLMLTAQRSSHIQKSMAEAKSLRQADNPEQRTDLYGYESVTETIEGRASVLLGTLVAFIEKEAADGT